MKIAFGVLGAVSSQRWQVMQDEILPICSQFGCHPHFVFFLSKNNFSPMEHEDCCGVFSVTYLVSATCCEYGEFVKHLLEYARRIECDYLVVLDKEGRYPLESINLILKELIWNDSDLVVAVPSVEKRKTLFQRKFVAVAGESVVLSVLNHLLGLKFEGWHCCYRGYNVRRILNLPFKYNSTGLDFNVEMIIQCVLAGLKIKEVISLGYQKRGLGFVVKVRVGFSMLRSCFYSLCHRVNVFYQRQFDVVDPKEIYDLKLGYASSHTFALSEVAEGASVLDIGCSDGSLSKLLQERGCRVRGIDQYDASCGMPVEDYIQIDLDVKRHSFNACGFDYILILDVLEHLRYADHLLEYLRDSMGGHKKSVVVLSVPNVSFFIMRLRLLFGSFNYGKLGILDLTHTRLFTEDSLILLLKQSGYEILSVKGVPAPFPKALGLNWVSKLMVRVNQFLINVHRGLFAYQIFVTARPKPVLNDFAVINVPDEVKVNE